MPLLLTGTSTEWRLEDPEHGSMRTLLSFDAPIPLRDGIKALIELTPPPWLPEPSRKHTPLAIQLDFEGLTEKFQMPLSQESAQNPLRALDLFELLKAPLSRRINTPIDSLYWDFTQKIQDEHLDITLYFLEKSCINPLLEKLKQSGFQVCKLSPLLATSVNLLPWRETQMKRSHYKFWGLAFLGTVISFSLFLPMKLMNETKIQSQESALENQQKKLREAQVHLQKAQQALHTQKRLVQEGQILSLKTQEWQTRYRQLQDLTELQPKELSLTAIQVQGSQWALTGIAQDRTSVLAWQQALQDTQVFSSVRLAELAPLSKTTDIQFELIAAPIQNTEPASRESE